MIWCISLTHRYICPCAKLAWGRKKITLAISGCPKRIERPWARFPKYLPEFLSLIIFFCSFYMARKHKIMAAAWARAGKKKHPLPLPHLCLPEVNPDPANPSPGTEFTDSHVVNDEGIFLLGRLAIAGRKEKQVDWIGWLGLPRF